MNKYRIVLIPKKELWEKFYSITKNCKDIYNDYIMAEERSVPHVTLMSFKVEDEKLTEIWEEIKDIKPVSIILEDLKLSEKGEFNFAAIKVKKNEIMEIRQRVFNTVIKFTDKFSDRQRNYFNPHFSLCDTLLPIDKIEEHFDFSFIENNREFPFYIAIGTSYGFGEVREIVIE